MQLTIVNTFYLLFITYHSLLYFPLLHVHCYAPGRRFRRKYAFLFFSSLGTLQCIIIIPRLASSPQCMSFKLFYRLLCAVAFSQKNETDVRFLENQISSKWNNYVSVHIFIHYVSCAMLCFLHYMYFAHHFRPYGSGHKA